MAQSGLFDMDERLAALSAAGDLLEQLSAVADFALFRPALDAALSRSERSRGGRPPADLIHHSDRGSQYCATDYQAALETRHPDRHVGKGNCYDNAMVGTFFKTLKSELVWRTAFQSRSKATIAIGRYVDGFYNPFRRHSALDFISPA